MSKQKNNQVTINVDGIKKAGKLLKAVSHDLRLKIIKVINEHGEVNVNVIYNTLKIEQSITSQHLKSLREVSIVKTRRDGKKIYYSLNTEKFAAIDNAIKILK